MLAALVGVPFLALRSDQYQADAAARPVKAVCVRRLEHLDALDIGGVELWVKGRHRTTVDIINGPVPYSAPTVDENAYITDRTSNGLRQATAAI